MAAPRRGEWLARHGERGLTIGLGVTVVGSMLAVGTVHPPWVLVFAGLAIACGALALVLDGARPREVPPAAALLAGLAAYTALQALPLPLELLRWLSPPSADVWVRTFALLGLPGPGWASLSIDPGATFTEALKWLAYAATFLAAAHLGRRHGATRGIGLVFASAATAALLTLGHAATSAEHLYGLYTPLSARPPWALAPLLNPNNLAGYLNLGFFCGAGLLVANRRSGPRWLIALLAAVTLAVSVMSASRGGVLALGVGALLLVAALFRVAQRGEGRVLRGLFTSVQVFAAMLVGAVFFFLGATPTVWASLQSEALDKFTILDWTRPMIAEHRWLGVGRGAYETAFPPYRGNTAHVVYQYAENFVVQWIAEWGLVVTAVALLGLAFELRPGRLRAGRSAVAAGATVGVLALLLQNLVDLGLELASVGLAVATVVGSLWGAARRADASRASARRDGTSAELGSDPMGSSALGDDDDIEPRWHAPAVSLAVAGVALLTATAALGLRPIVTERHRLQDAYLAAGLDPAAQGAFARELAASLRAHPGDPFLPLLGALDARRAGKNPLPWLNRALERDPGAGRPYLLLAQVLAGRGARAQALNAASLAVAREARLASAAAPLVVEMARDADAIVRAAPPGAAAVDWLLASAAALPSDRAAEARLTLLEAAVAREPHQPRPRLALARAVLGLLRSNPAAPPCRDREPACRARVEEQAKALELLSPDAPDGALLRAELMLLSERARAALDLLGATCSRWPRSVECHRLRVRAADRTGDLTALAQGRDELLLASCDRAEPCVATARWLGQLYARRGAWAEAAALFERAARESESVKDWEQAALAATRAGQLARAQQARSRARRAGGPERSDLDRQLDEARRERILRAPNDK